MKNNVNYNIECKFAGRQTKHSETKEKVMPSVLGIYIENNLIKYSKVSKDHDNIKIEASGVRFYDNAEEAIKNIVEETFSYKTPISVNLSDEKYTYTELFNLLSKKDLEKAVTTEFEYFCTDAGKNKNALEYRRVFIDNLEDKDKKTVLYSYVDKASSTARIQAFESVGGASFLVPLPIAIMNLGRFKGKKDSIIVNIEKETAITTVVNGELYRVDVIPKGMKDILDNITVKENSYEKAYQICKNSTIYTAEGKDLQTDENEHMEDIMPTLYSIIQEIREVIAEKHIKPDNIYITGMGAVINNIDLYFQENFPNQQCEILTPYFAEKTNIKLNIKDYIEVNSATALALQGLGSGAKDINFTSQKGFGKISELLTADIGKGGKSKGKSSINIGEWLKSDLSKKPDAYDKWLIRTAVRFINNNCIIYNYCKSCYESNI